jgi:phosphoglycerol transferase MdoB-like AlkP superfamily enzyme
MANIADFGLNNSKSGTLIIFTRESNYYMGVWRQLAEYFYIKKRDPNVPHTQWMRYMHGINRISIFMFLAGIIILLLKLFVFKHH